MTSTPHHTHDSVDWAELSSQLTEGALITNPGIIASSSNDHSTTESLGTADVLIRARSIDDVQATMRFASKHAIPVVPQGARTGLSGAANAVDGAILLNLSFMKEILEIDTTARTATVQPGVINQQLKDAVAQHDLSYPPDPGSVAISSIGGNVATNAGGLCCVKYGVTRNYVRNLKVVLADGTLTQVGRTTIKKSAGFDLCNLFIGSEGTLGVVVEITLDLIPKLPAMYAGVATFPDEITAARTVEELMASEAQPAMVELVDRTTLKLLNDFKNFDLDDTVGAYLMVGADGSGSTRVAEEELKLFAQIAEKNSALDVDYSMDAEDTEPLTQIRREAQPAWAHYVERNGGGQVLDDICLPRSELANFYTWLTERKKSSKLVIGGVSHAGDGNLHPMAAYDKNNPDEVAEAQKFFDDVMALGLELGGTISGEHGIGHVKAEWLVEELDDGARAMHQSIKQALDPQGILNPNKLFRHF